MIEGDRIIHSFKTGLACLMGFALTKAIHLPVDQWLIITILVVMCAQISVGSILQKSYMRFLGTLSGSIIALFTLLLFGKNIYIDATVLVISGIVFSYVATGKTSFSDAGPLGAVTVTIILISPIANTTYALGRFIEITSGLLIATLVSQFVFPIHARSRLRLMQAKALRQIGEYVDLVFLHQADEPGLKNRYDLDEAIVKSLLAQRNLASDSKREFIGKLFNTVHFAKLLKNEKEIFRSIVCMHYANDLWPSFDNHFLQLPEIIRFHQQIIAFLNQIATIIESERTSDHIILPDWNVLQTTAARVVAESSAEEGVYINGYLFCTYILIKEFSELTELFQIKDKKKP